MSQHDYNIANQTFPATRTDLNNALGAVATNNSGNSAPSTTYANQWWFDLDDNKLYMRNKDNDAWVEILTIGATSDKVESIGVDDLTFADNSKLILGTGGDLEIYHDGSNSYIQDNGTGDLKITSNGNAISLQKGTSETLAFFDTDAGVFLYHDNTERLQTNSSGIDVSGSVQVDDGGSLGFGGTNYKIEGSSSANHRIAFHTDGSERARFDTSGNLFVAKTSAAYQTVGHELLASGRAFHTADGGKALSLVRNSSDGQIMDFYDSSGTEIGRISTTSTGIALGTPKSSGSGLHLISAAILPSTSTGGTADGTKDLGSSSSRFKDIYLGGGAFIGGTGSANQLDDYEEGTWTPTLAGTWNSNPTSMSGKYTKIGQIVTLSMIWQNGAKSSSTSAHFTSLPFAPSANSTAPVSDTGVDDNGIVLCDTGGRIFTTANSFGSDNNYLTVTYISS